jgi:hypothetical protein
MEVMATIIQADIDRVDEQKCTRSSAADSDELEAEGAEANLPGNDFQRIVFGSICPVLTVTEVESMRTRDTEEAFLNFRTKLGRALTKEFEQPTRIQANHVVRSWFSQIP